MRNRLGLTLILAATACGGRSPLSDELPAPADDRAIATPTTTSSPARGGSGSPAPAIDAGTPVADAAPPADAAAPVPDSPPPHVGAPRAIAPLSTATSTSQLPRFRWELPAGADGAQIEICADRACTQPVSSFLAVGTSGAPSSPLARGVYFWRLRGTVKGAVGTQASPVWELFVGPRSAPIATSWGSVLDLNGDGRADIALGTPNVTGGPYGTALMGAVRVHLGSTGGPLAAFTTLVDLQDNGPFSEIGYAVASAGDVNGDGYADLVAGAPGGGASPGAAYVFLGGPNGPSPTPTTILGKVPHQYFGTSVSGVGDVNGDGYADVVVGAWVGAGSTGGAYLYLGGPNGIDTIGTPLATSWHSQMVVAGAGDLNGDGFADVLVASASANGASGLVDVFFGGPGGLSPTPTTLHNPGAAFGEFGYSASCAGDVDGDGYADLLVGSPGVTPAAYVYRGNAGGISTTPLVLPMQGGPTDTLSFPYSPEFGSAVSSAGDVNGDGYSDVVVGTPGDAQFHLYLGGPGGLSTTPAALGVAGLKLDSELGASLAGGGDVNGDGYGDVVVAARGVGYRDAAGAAYVFLGGPGGLVSLPIAIDDPGAVLSVSNGN